MSSGRGGPLPASPPAEKATARKDQARQPGTGDSGRGRLQSRLSQSMKQMSERPSRRTSTLRRIPRR
jgi:hypothetical protein